MRALHKPMLFLLEGGNAMLRRGLAVRGSAWAIS